MIKVRNICNIVAHNLKISFRNLRKYKTQAVISICAMAVSLTLLAIVSSILLSYHPSSLLSQPYANRVEEFASDKMSIVASREERELIMSHQFKSVKDIFLISTSYYSIMATADPASKNEHSMMLYTNLMDPDYLKFLGVKSVYSGEKIGVCNLNEVVITDWLAKKLFEDENPIGKRIRIDMPYLSRLLNKNDSEEYVVKDVIERSSRNNQFLHSDNHLFLFTDNFPNDAVFLYFLLRDGASRDDLRKELSDILPNQEFQLLNVKSTYDESKSFALRKSVILFLFLFVLVSFANYMRQQTQLFRLREREIALRTSVGSKTHSLFSLFSTEIVIVLLLTLALALTLVTLVSGYLTTNYHELIESQNYNFDSAYPITFVATSILMALSLAVVAIVVKRIRKDQTGLALRMRPRPMHRLRNVGLIVQMTISILFLWMTTQYFLSIESIKELYGIPEDAEKYKRSLIINLNEVSNEDQDKIYSRIDSLVSVENMYKYSESSLPFDADEDFPYYSYYTEISQDSENIVEFYDLKVKLLPGKVNPDRYVLISEDFKQMLIDKNLWNGKTINLPFRDYGEYEIKGVYESIPLKLYPVRKSVITINHGSPIDGYGNTYGRIILPKKGRGDEARNEIENIIRDVIPSRVDINIKNFFNSIVESEYNMISAIITIIYILSAISIITTVAAIYSGVSLDTRRRRKEMALRKLNGARRKAIAMIFVRSYIIIISVAAAIALPLGLISFPKLAYENILVMMDINTTTMLLSYLLVLLFIILITGFTIAWKIRDVMKANPVEYLKE